MADVLTHIDTIDVEIVAQEELDISADGDVSVAVWGGILGDIKQQTDLADYIKQQVAEGKQEDMPTIPIEYIEALQ
ncbi:MAG TPA: hypothetical protein DIW30_01860 [Bacteroidales bacterium]|nr:hypothetical protein [Bacteroidales bacterium]